MKKITLAVFAVIASLTNSYSQTNIQVKVPQKTNSYVDIFAGGTDETAEFTSIYLYSASELGALTGTDVTGIGIPFDDGASAIAAGSCTVYLENTSDITYSKGTSFTAATATMTSYYTGNLNIPSTSGASTVNLTFPAAQHFTYTGGGIYVAVKWSANNPNSLPAYNNGANSASFPANFNQTLGNMGGFEGAVVGSSLTDVMSLLPVRACVCFNAVNTATNEVNVLNIIAMGKVAKNLNDPQDIYGLVKNASIGSLANITVSLNITGANPFTDVQTVSNLGAGQTATVLFAPYTPTAIGSSSITVLTANDQNNSNNSTVWTQSMACNVMANNPPIGTYTNALGYPNGGAFWVNPFYPMNNQILTGVRIAIGASSTNAGKNVYGVLLDNSGTLIAATNTMVLASTTSGFQTFNFSAEDIQNSLTNLTGGESYLIGLAQPESGHYPMGFLRATDSYIPGNDIIMYSGGGGYLTYGYFGIEPILGPGVFITQTNSVICKGEQVNLVADGTALSYTWTGNNANAGVISTPNSTVGPQNNTLTTLNATPVVSGAGTTSFTYTLKGVDNYGCINSTSVVQKVSGNCYAGINVNSMSNSNISLYPNPSVAGKSEIHGLEGKNTITVFNMLGQQIFNVVSNSETVGIDLSNQPSGNYFIKITNDNNQSKSLKVINQN